MGLKLNKSLIKKAVDALKGTAYEKNKEIIRKMFDLPPSKCPVILRLRVIDSFYSTNFIRRQLGFEELAQAIENLGSDNDVKNRLRSVVKNNCLSIDEGIQELFTREDWGAIRKDGRKAGHGRSLISKYFYFLSGFNFPIYDSLVNEGLEDLDGHYPKDFSDLLARLSELKKTYRTTYDHLDQFLWLWGKTYYGTYSLLVDDKEMYKCIEGKTRAVVCEILRRHHKYTNLEIFIRATLNAEKPRSKL